MIFFYLNKSSINPKVRERFSHILIALWWSALYKCAWLLPEETGHCHYHCALILSWPWKSHTSLLAAAERPSLLVRRLSHWLVYMCKSLLVLAPSYLCTYMCKNQNQYSWSSQNILQMSVPRVRTRVINAVPDSWKNLQMDLKLSEVSHSGRVKINRKRLRKQRQSWSKCLLLELYLKLFVWFFIFMCQTNILLVPFLIHFLHVMRKLYNVCFCHLSCAIVECIGCQRNHF